MKNLLPVLSITLISTIVSANTPLKTAAAIKVEQQTISKILQTESSVRSEITLAQNEISKVTSAELWKNLDINRDDSISKTEAIYSLEVSDNWDRLDINKDQKLDFNEFSKLFSKKIN